MCLLFHYFVIVWTTMSVAFVNFSVTIRIDAGVGDSRMVTLRVSLCVCIRVWVGEEGQSSSELPNYTGDPIAKWVKGGRASGSGAKTNVKSLTTDFSPRPTKSGTHNTLLHRHCLHRTPPQSLTAGTSHSTDINIINNCNTAPSPPTPQLWCTSPSLSILYRYYYRILYYYNIIIIAPNSPDRHRFFSSWYVSFLFVLFNFTLDRPLYATQPTHNYDLL